MRALHSRSSRGASPCCSTPRVFCAYEHTSRFASGCHGNSYTKRSAVSKNLHTQRRGAFVCFRCGLHHSAQLLGCACEIWLVQCEVVRTDRCRSETVHLNFIQRSLDAVSKPIFPLLVLQSRCAEPTHVLLQFAGKNLLVMRLCLTLDPFSLPRQDPIRISCPSCLSLRRAHDFDKEAFLHLTQLPLRACFHASKYQVVSVDHAAQIFATVANSSMGWPALSLIHCAPAVTREKLLVSRVRLECQRDFASVARTHAPVARAPHTNFVRQMRVGAPSKCLLPGFCDLQVLDKPLETATAGVFPAAAWVRRNRLIWSSRIFSRHTCYEPQASRSRLC